MIAEQRNLPSHATKLMAGGCSLSLKSLRELKLAHETCASAPAFLSGLCVSVVIRLRVFSGFLQVRSAYLLTLNCTRKIQMPG